MGIATVFKTALITGATTALVLAASAHAEVITAEYTVTLSNATSWPAGVTLSGTYAFDSEAVGTALDADTVLYPAQSHLVTLRTADGTPTICSATNPRIQVVNDGLRAGLLLDQYQVAGNLGGCAFEGLQVINHSVTLQNLVSPPNTALASTDLPLTDEELSGLSSRTGLVVFRTGDGSIGFVSGTLDSFDILNEEAAPVFACDGFFPPFDGPIGLTRKERRVIPLRLEILDDQDFGLGLDDIAAPIVSVRRSAAVVDEDLDALVDSPGRPTSGNQFVWNETEQVWEYNLATAPFSAAGTYTVTVLAGDENYGLDPTCSGVFVRR